MNPELLSRLRGVTGEERELLDGNALDRGLYFASSRLLVDSSLLLQEGELITLRPHTRFIDFPAHRHNYIEIVYMVSGETTHVVSRNETVTLRAGEILMMNQHEEHAILAASAEDIAVNIIVLPAFFDVVLSHIGQDHVLGSFLMNSLRERDDGITYLHFRVAQVLPIQLIMECLVYDLIFHVPGGRKINQTTMSLLFLHLLNATDRLHFSARQQTEGIVVAALREIEENYAFASLTSIAKSFRCSLSYVSRMIKKATGSTFAQLLQKKRMDKAAALLRQSSLTVQEIMHAVGYQNSSHFYRLFENRFNASPHEMRKISLQK